MMQSEAIKILRDNNAFDACWIRIGIQGDRSCPRLTQAVHCRNCPVFSAAGQLLLRREAPAQYMEVWTQRIAQSETTGTMEEVSVIVFRIGDEWLAFDTHCVAEVVDMRPIHRVPHRSDKLLLGLANIRGELHLCISLRELLEIDESSEDQNAKSASSSSIKKRLIVVEQDRSRWAFPVDEVDGVDRTEAMMLEDLPHTVEKNSSSYSRAIFTHKDKKVGMLSQARIFQALEKTIR
jgi:chemotaxis-related protein WspD